MIFYISKIILIFSITVLLIFISILISPYHNYLEYGLIILSFLTLVSFIFYKPKRPQYSNKVNDDESTLLSDHEIILPDDKIEPLINLIESYSTLKSFSMALIGKWGSGKSSYLKTLNEKLQDNYEIITINVWQLENSENITNELKKEFDNIIFEYNKTLWLTQLIKRLFIRDYFAVISKYTTKSEIKINFAFEQTIQNSQSEFNNLLKEVLGRKKVLLLIDELDRIESKDEILNIFKLIRYTASFDNVFVLTALDIQQVEKELDDIDYIHKVFNLKYLIPTIDKDELVTYFEEYFLPKFSNLIDNSSLNQKIINLEKDIKLISSYREVKNIFNDTYTFVEFLSETTNNWYDFISFDFIFKLNLLKAIDFEVYSFLLIDDGFQSYITYLNLERNSEEETKFLENNQQLNNFLYKLENFQPYIRIDNAQHIDIYKQHKIYNYHIDDKKYQTFISNIETLETAYQQIKYNPTQNQMKFLLNILDKNQSDQKNHKLILNEIIALILSSNSSSYKIFEKLATYDFIHKETKLIYMGLAKDNNKNNVIPLLISNICNQDNNFDYNLIEDLIINYLNTHKLEEETIYSWLYSNTSNNNSYNIYKILYIYYKESTNIKKVLINETKKVEYIMKLIEILKTSPDYFIEDKENYSIILSNLQPEKNISGKEIKKEINELQQARDD